MNKLWCVYVDYSKVFDSMKYDLLGVIIVILTDSNSPLGTTEINIIPSYEFTSKIFFLLQKSTLKE